MDGNNKNESTSLADVSAKSIVSSIGENGRVNLLQALIGKMSKDDKQTLYESLGEVLYGGVRLSNKYTYAIFRVCDIYKFIENDQYLYTIYEALDKFDQGDHCQIMFIDKGDDIVRFDCARSSFLTPLNEPLTVENCPLIEHPEARLLHQILHEKQIKSLRKITDGSIVVRFGNQELNSEDNIGYGERKDIDLFATCICTSGAFNCLEADDWVEEFEFKILVKGEPYKVLFRQFECYFE
jgi:hypothetical protein